AHADVSGAAPGSATNQNTTYRRRTVARAICPCRVEFQRDIPACAGRLPALRSRSSLLEASDSSDRSRSRTPWATHTACHSRTLATEDGRAPTPGRSRSASRQAHRKGRALPHGALHGDRAAVGIHDRLGDGEAQAGAAGGGGARLVDAIETL